MQNNILKGINDKKNILIVGKESSGKTFFALNKLLPELIKSGQKPAYFKDCDALDTNAEGDIFIIDEVELLADKDFLEQHHPDQIPYYPDAYLRRVNKWHEKLAQVTKPSIYIITRNTDESIDNIVNNYHELEWNNQPVNII